MGEDEALAVARSEGGIAITIITLLFADVCVMHHHPMYRRGPTYFHPLCFDVTIVRRKTMMKMAVVE